MLAQEQMLLLGRRTAEEKIASFLVGWRERLAHIGDNRQTIALPMSRQDIADYLGLTIETVSRTLTRFEREKMLIIVTAASACWIRPGPQPWRRRENSGATAIKIDSGQSPNEGARACFLYQRRSAHANRVVACCRLRRRDVRGLRRGAGLG